MSEKKKETAVGRRAFFKKAGFGVGAVAVGLAANKSMAAEPSKAASSDAGYRETAHVKKYYDLARF